MTENEPAPWEPTQADYEELARQDSAKYASPWARWFPETPELTEATDWYGREWRFLADENLWGQWTDHDLSIKQDAEKLVTDALTAALEAAAELIAKRRRGTAS